MTPSPAAEFSPTSSSTPSPAASTSTQTQTAAATSISSQTVTPSPSPVDTATPPGSAPTATATVTAIAFATATPPSSATTSPVATATQVEGANADALKLEAVPNPQSGPTIFCMVQLAGPCGSLQARLYTRAMALVAKTDLNGSYRTGWNRVVWAAPALPPGVYFLRIKAGDGKAVSGPLVLLR